LPLESRRLGRKGRGSHRLMISICWWRGSNCQRRRRRGLLVKPVLSFASEPRAVPSRGDVFFAPSLVDAHQDKVAICIECRAFTRRLGREVLLIAQNTEGADKKSGRAEGRGV
jgi:hypothetical protein